MMNNNDERIVTRIVHRDGPSGSFPLEQKAVPVSFGRDYLLLFELNASEFPARDPVVPERVSSVVLHAGVSST